MDIMIIVFVDFDILELPKYGCALSMVLMNNTMWPQFSQSQQSWAVHKQTEYII